jgi:hypothetical protein
VLTIARTAVAVLIFIGLVFAAATLLLNGCATTAYVKADPPAPRHEVIGPKPHPNAIWLGGHWAWNGREYNWIAGRWEASPRGDVWVAGHWKKTPKGWVWTPGRWTR